MFHLLYNTPTRFVEVWKWLSAGGWSPKELSEERTEYNEGAEPYKVVLATA
jgi:hypothetical protein